MVETRIFVACPKTSERWVLRIGDRAGMQNPHSTVAELRNFAKMILLISLIKDFYQGRGFGEYLRPLL
jgi:hypothetical protein